MEDLPDPWKCPQCCQQLSQVKAEYKKRKAAAESVSKASVGGEEREEQDPPIAIDAQRFDPVEQAAKMHAHLSEHGFVVVKAVANEKEVHTAKTLLWDYLEEYGQVDRDDAESWRCDKEWAPNSKDGIIYGRGVGQSKFMWHLRLAACLLSGLNRWSPDTWQFCKLRSLQTKPCINYQNPLSIIAMQLHDICATGRFRNLCALDRFLDICYWRIARAG